MEAGAVAPGTASTRTHDLRVHTDVLYYIRCVVMTRHGNLALTTTYYACSLYSPEVYKYTRHVLVLVVGALFMYYIQRWYSLEYYTHTAFGFYPHITINSNSGGACDSAHLTCAGASRSRAFGIDRGTASHTHAFIHACMMTLHSV